MLDTGSRSGWVFKKIRSKTKWAVEIARQKQFKIRPIYTARKPKEPPDQTALQLHARVVPERRAATQAKKCLKEKSLKEKLLSNIVVPKKNARNKRGRPKRIKQSENLENIHTEHHPRKDVTSIDSNAPILKKAKRRGRPPKQANVKQNKTEEDFIREFEIDPCIVRLPKLGEEGAVQNNENETDINAFAPLPKVPERVIVLGESDKDPIIVSDDDSDVEIVAEDLTIKGTLCSPIVLNDEVEEHIDYNSETDDVVDTCGEIDDYVTIDFNDKVDCKDSVPESDANESDEVSDFASDEIDPTESISDSDEISHYDTADLNDEIGPHDSISNNDINEHYHEFEQAENIDYDGRDSRDTATFHGDIGENNNIGENRKIDENYKTNQRNQNDNYNNFGRDQVQNYSFANYCDVGQSDVPNYHNVSEYNERTGRNDGFDVIHGIRRNIDIDDTDTIDPNDADAEESSDDDGIGESGDDTGSFDGSADNLSNDDSVEEDNDNDENDSDTGDDCPFFSKFRNNFKTYNRYKRKCLIAPATFQPKKITVSPAKFSVPSSFRTSPFLTFSSS